MTSRPLNAISFALPCRTFEISASVTVNETLPKVNEFVLRLIRVCEGLTDEEVAQYFGFSGKETRVILEALRNESLIRIEDGLIRLTEYAESKFYTDDDIPRFSKVEPRTDVIDFDLLTFHPLAPQTKKEPVPFAADIGCGPDKIAGSSRLAEQAYQQHFQRIVRIRERNNDPIEIYQMSSVKSRRIFEVPIDVGFVLERTGEIERVIKYDDDATDEYRMALESAVSDALNQHDSDQMKWLDQYIDRLDERVLLRYRKKIGFAFEDYVRDVTFGVANAYPDGTIPIIGNLYMPENQVSLVSLLKQALPRSAKGATRDASCVWMAPDYLHWGRTALMNQAYWEFAKTLGGKQSEGDAGDHVHLLYPGTKETKWALERQFWSRPSKNVHFYSSDAMGGRVEIFFVPTVLACVMFHYKPPGNIGALIPFGYATTNPTLMRSVLGLLGETLNYGRNYVGQASSDRGAKNGAVNFLDHFGFLHYSDLNDRPSDAVFGAQVARSQSIHVAPPDAKEELRNSRLAVQTEESKALKALVESRLAAQAEESKALKASVDKRKESGFRVFLHQFRTPVFLLDPQRQEDSSTTLILWNSAVKAYEPYGIDSMRMFRDITDNPNAAATTRSLDAFVEYDRWKAQRP